MKRFFLFLSCCLMSTFTFAQAIAPESGNPAEAAAGTTIPSEIAIIPEPVSVVKNEGHFVYLPMLRSSRPEIRN
jgi:hexosaminidase